MEYQTLRQFLGQACNIDHKQIYTFTAEHPRFGTSKYRCCNARQFIESYSDDEEILDMYEVTKAEHTGTGFEYCTPYTLKLRLKKEYRPKASRKTKEQIEREKSDFEWRVRGRPWLEKLLSGKIVVNKE